MLLRNFIASLSFCLIFLSLFSQGTWIQKTDFGGTARWGAISFAIGNYGFIGTGSAGANSADFWQYDPNNDSWTQKADFGGGGRSTAVGFSIGNLGYVGTGYYGGYFNDFWEYDPMLNSWSQKSNFGGAGTTYAVGFSIGNKGYIGTGADLNILRKDFWEYSPQNNSWTQKANFGGTSRYLCTSFTIGNRGYVLAGIDSSGQPFSGTQDLWEYNPTTNGWTKKANFPGSPRSEMTSFTIGNYAYAGLGTTDLGSGTVSDFWKYNPTTNAWTPDANFGGGLREMAIGFSIGCKGYVGTGWINDNSPKKDFWEFTPDTCYLEGIYENKISTLVSIYPNPTNGKMSLNCKENISLKKLKVFNVDGDFIFQLEISSLQPNIDLSQLNNGEYILQLESDKGYLTKRIIIQKQQ